jgi:tRNA threonylcarbamoyladenosine biosynthesis protein TsaB
VRLLAIETSHAIGSVAIVDGGNLTQLQIESPREQTARLLPIIEQLLDQHALGLPQLDAIVIGRGPGSFTGLRVAAAVAQGLAMAAKLRIVSVSSLAALAERARREHKAVRTLVCVDARMGEVYWGLFESRGAQTVAVGEDRIDLPKAVPVPDEGPWVIAGDAVATYPEQLRHLLDAAGAAYPDLKPSAQDLLTLAAFEIGANRTLAPEDVEQAYLRDASAWKTRR